MLCYSQAKQATPLPHPPSGITFKAHRYKDTQLPLSSSESFDGTAPKINQHPLLGIPVPTSDCPPVWLFSAPQGWCDGGGGVLNQEAERDTLTGRGAS